MTRYFQIKRTVLELIAWASKLKFKIGRKQISYWVLSDYDYYFKVLRPILNKNYLTIAEKREGAHDFCEKVSSLLANRKMENIITEALWKNIFLSAINNNNSPLESPQEHLRLKRPVFRKLKYVGTLIHIHNILLGMGHFSLAGCLREHAIETIKNSKFIPMLLKSSDRRHIAGVALEDGNYPAFKSVFPLNRVSKQNRHFIDWTARSLCERETNGTRERNLPLESDVSLAYRNYIDGKSVAIVGPSSSTEEKGPEIDKFDIVVRCNVLNSELSWDVLAKGKRCDISYLSVGHGELYLRDKPKLPDDLKWVCFKHQPHFQKTGNYIPVGDMHSIFARNYNTLNPLLFIGTANGIPNIVSDLLYFNPKKIKIFFVDMMLTKQRHEGYYDLYRGTVENVSAFRHASGKTHDPGSNFLIMKMISQNPRILLDDRLKEVLSLTMKSFYEELELHYGCRHSTTFR